MVAVGRRAGGLRALERTGRRGRRPGGPDRRVDGADRRTDPGRARPRRRPVRRPAGRPAARGRLRRNARAGSGAASGRGGRAGRRDPVRAQRPLPQPGPFARGRSPGRRRSRPRRTPSARHDRPRGRSGQPAARPAAPLARRGRCNGQRGRGAERGPRDRAVAARRRDQPRPCAGGRCRPARHEHAQARALLRRVDRTGDTAGRRLCRRPAGKRRPELCQALARPRPCPR